MNLPEVPGGLEMETLFKVEGPFKEIEDGFGAYGVIHIHPVSKNPMCHVCGMFTSNLGLHARAHKLNSKQYREKFSIMQSFPLISKKLSESFSEAANTRNLKYKNNHWIKVRKLRNKKYLHKKAGRSNHFATLTEARKNINNICDLQLAHRYLLLADESGRQPSKLDVERNDPALLSAILRRYGTINSFRRANDLEVIKKQPSEYSDATLIGALRRFFKDYHRVPKTKDFTGTSPSWKAICKRFGSWRKAMSVAGII